MMTQRNAASAKIERIKDTAQKLATQVGGTFHENRDKRADLERREARTAA